MNRKLFFLFIIALAAAAVSAEDLIHIVTRGETIYSIARTYGITQDELMRYNSIIDPRRLAAGQQLKIPGNSSGSVFKGSGQVSGFVEYKAVRGDTLYSIARNYEVTLQALLAANDLTINSMLKAGDVLKIPQTVTIVPAPIPAPSPVPLPVPVPLADPRAQTNRVVDPAIRWPVSAREVTYMTGKLSGVVLVGEQSESVKSLTQGTVVSAGPYRGFGRVAIVEATGGYLYVYGGCESLSVKEGDRVRAGTELGRLGMDAVSEKPQLFLMVYRNSAPIDPAKAPRA